MVGHLLKTVAKQAVKAAPHITKVAKAISATAGAISASALAYISVRKAVDYERDRQSRE